METTANIEVIASVIGIESQIELGVKITGRIIIKIPLNTIPLAKEIVTETAGFSVA